MEEQKESIEEQPKEEEEVNKDWKLFINKYYLMSSLQIESTDALL